MPPAPRGPYSEPVTPPNLDSIRQAASDGLVVVLTGAGISAESGIPTFRGPEGYWTVGSSVYRPQEMATQAAFRRMPEEVWRWYLHRRSVCRDAQPNRAHNALAELDNRLGDRFLLVTQNVDGLHLRAGSTLDRTYQIHGNVDYMRCAEDCSQALEPLPLEAVDTLEPPRCSACGEMARPHVLWFDEYYDENLYRFESSLKAAADCAVLITVGTSGETNLPQQMVALAARSGAMVVDINPQQNPFAELAASMSRGMWLEGTACKWVPEVANAICEA